MTIWVLVPVVRSCNTCPVCVCATAPQNDGTAKALVDDLAALMATHINSFDARGLANSAWAFGKLKYSPNQKLPALIAAAAMDKMKAFSAQNLSNLLWSFVYLHHRNEQLLTAVAKQVSCFSCGAGRGAQSIHAAVSRVCCLVVRQVGGPTLWDCLIFAVGAARHCVGCPESILPLDSAHSKSFMNAPSTSARRLQMPPALMIWAHNCHAKFCAHRWSRRLTSSSLRNWPMCCGPLPAWSISILS